ncbi:aspartyl/asparaginyl beta-hydroxylase [Bos taurus]|uniref:Aspartyl/asparaginyl beta-hydroxylase n=2 Tax=Bos TaxID=9903 RepID=ASPH_BOVIN|nr:aspartyl/asparaginyl beta-hydroxylase [Bos taurus]Q28056.1 RecName: Full=Aspartyl/asparaginyl beta-hydroxylase; AltName: Full=Aspartate beta-hydroxylase; Short=ASP beta-hydroxylase; AltName: Full=Peptide-aspartate beta-dioxygenase [Bos taurus]AAA03563.1 aspartyl (asparaginyl) beta hydroxylase [Bos taurus]DAA22735.1 TPA: aspartyl/asparaginyl beta-hydroxylase [Bos taurus]
MAPRKNAKGGGGNSSSSSSGSPTGCTSGGSSSPGARRETKQGGLKNGRKGGLSGSSFFTWFMVIALLGVWTSVAVVWFDLVDYEEVLAKAKDFRYNLSEVLQGKLGIYDADGDGDFDVDDAKVLLGLKEKPAPKPTVPPEEADMYPWLEDQVLESPGRQNIEDEVYEQVQSLDETVYSEPGENLPQEPEGPAEELQPDDHVFVGSDADDRYEPMGTGAVHEETEDSYHIEETASPAYSQDMEDMMYEQENPDSSEPVVVDDAERTYQETDDVTYRDYDEQDHAVDNSNTILEEPHMPPAEEQQEVPPETNKKADEPGKKGKVKKKKPKLLNKFDKTIKAELDAAEKLRKRGKIEEAVNAFEELVRKYPQSPGARYGKAQCEDDLAEKRRSNEILRRAIETYQEAASLPDAPTDLVKLSLKRRSDRQQFLGHMRGSLLTLQKLVQLFPDDTALKNDLGVGYLLIGDNDSAKKVYEEVLSVTPNDGFAKVHYGFILKAQNKIAESIPYLKEGIESGDPGTDDGRFYFHLGDAMQRVGNKEAYRWYELGHQRGHFASVWQRSLYNVQGLKAQPWWTPKETGYTELVKSLERNWKLIRDEGLAAMDRTHGLFLPEDENLREKGDWSQFTLWQQGRKNENACKGAPKTCSLLDKFPETTGCRRGQIKYSIMHPGTHVWPHTGPTNCRLRMHLGLVIPKEGCKIRCANETRTWEEGKVLIFDDSFEHEVWQDAASFRLIFIVDVWHPELTPHQRRSLPAI